MTDAIDRAVQRREGLERQLTLRADMGDALARFMLDHGEWFTWSDSGLGQGEAKNCYGNAANVALFTNGWTYCEGFASTGEIPIAYDHAWCVNDETGEIAELTWRHLGNACGFCVDGVVTDEDGAEDACEWCHGTGEQDEEHSDRSDTVYLGVRIDDALLRRVLLDQGMYGVLGSRLFRNEIVKAHDVC